MQNMRNLFAIANGNSDSIQTAFESVIANTTPEKASILREFAAWVEAKALISINVKTFVAVELLNGGSHQNMYEWAREQARLSGRSVEDALRERLHRFYEKRVAFDRAFEDGEQFRYGALNAGTAGLPEYDPYSIILTREYQSSLSKVAYLPGDSLKICYRDGSLDMSLIETQATPHSHRHLLATKELEAEVHLAKKCDWGVLVASSRRYFEVIFIGHVRLNAVECVRVLKSEHDRMWNLAFASFGRKLTDAERALVHDFVQLRRGAMEGKVKIEILI